MIAAAVAAGAVCLAIVMREAMRSVSVQFGTARVFVAGAWACCWLAYGVNLTGFPQPSAMTIWLLAAGCAGALLMVPASRIEQAPDTAAFGTRARIVAGVLAAIALFLIVWDISYLTMRFREFGWSVGLKIHRLDRMTQTGAFSLPGIESLRALACAAGALAFARWIVTRRPMDAVIAVLGFVAAAFGTGRWDIINYSVWIFIAARLLTPASQGLRAFVRQAAFCLVMGIIFVGHGQLFGKNEHAANLANLPEQARMKAAGKVVRTEVPPAPTAKPAPAPATSAAPKTPQPAAATTPVAAPTPSLPTPAPSAAPATVAPCPRWTTGVQASNESFRTLPPAAIALLLYAAGPFAALDRTLCEGPADVRQVIFYWPKKILRALKLRPPETLLAVDPFVDVGIPFNNYSVVFPFVNELGLWAGPIAWLVLAGALRLVSGRMAQARHPALVVAAAAPLSMAIRTPWANTYFDGTLAIWLLAALVSWWASRGDAQAGTSRR